MRFDAYRKTYGLLESAGRAPHPGRADADVLIAPTRVRYRKRGNEWTVQ